MSDKLRFTENVLPEITGWAYIPGEAEVHDRARIVVQAGEAVLVQQIRTIERPDVDLHFDDQTGPTGFVLPIAGIVTLSLMLNALAAMPKWLRISCGNAWLGTSGLPLGLRDPAHLRSLALIHDDAIVKIADLWYATSHEMSFRLEPSKNCDSILSIRFYQISPVSKLPVKLVAESLVRPGQAIIVQALLINPFSPILILVFDEEDQLIASDLVPFPSMSRNGLHSSETLTCCDGSLTSMAAYSDGLLREVCESGEPSRPFSIGDIKTAADEAAGSESFFSRDCLEWLHQWFGLGIRPLGEDGSTYPADRLAPFAARRRPPGATLLLPPGALPTLSGLVSRGLADRGSPSGTAAPYVTADRRTGQPGWFVSMPAAGSWLDELQPEATAPLYPRLVEPTAATEGSKPLPIPLAIVQTEQLPGRSEQLVYPVASGLTGSPIASELQQRISVIVPIRETTRRFEIFIDLLAEQTAAPQIELVIVDNTTTKSVTKKIQEKIEEKFSKSHIYVSSETYFNHSALVNAGVSASSGSLIAVANSSLLLSNSETIEYLSKLASSPRVASASCMILNKIADASEAMFRSAGYFLDRYDFILGSLLLSEPDYTILQPGIWPVAANSLDIVVVRREVWEEVGGLDAGRFPDTGNDIDFAIRSAGDSRFHVCSTTVSAICERRRSRGKASRFHMSSSIGHEELDRLLRRATALRRLA